MIGIFPTLLPHISLETSDAAWLTEVTNKKLQRTTIRDVAAEANVSISTVSLYIQGRPGVGPDTGRRIAAAIEKVGYVPRTRSKNGARTKIFGLLVGDLPVPAYADRFYDRVIRAIEAEARIQGYGMLFSIIEPGQLPQMVLDDQVRGIMILGGSEANDQLAIRLVEHGVPLVLVNNYVSGLQVNAIVPDNVRGGSLAFEHLSALGHRRIAIIEGPRKYKTLTDRLYGALRASDELGIDIPSDYRQESLSAGHSRKGYLEMKQLLALPTPPSAVFAISDKTALGALDAAKEMGLCIPDDISIMGFDNVADTVPPLTTINVPKQEMGVLAMKRLVETIEKKEIPRFSPAYTPI